MKLILFILCFIISACAKNGDANYVSVDSSLQPLVTQFVQDGQTQGRAIAISNLTVQFGGLNDRCTNSLPGEILWGCCQVSGHPTITIDPTIWPTLDQVTQKMLMYHELGHCVLHKSHEFTTWTTPSDGVFENSIMYPELVNESVFTAYEAHYLAEFFK